MQRDGEELVTAHADFAAAVWENLETSHYLPACVVLRKSTIAAQGLRRSRAGPTDGRSWVVEPGEALGAGSPLGATKKELPARIVG